MKRRAANGIKQIVTGVVGFVTLSDLEKIDGGKIEWFEGSLD